MKEVSARQERVKVKLSRLPHAEGLPPPAYQTEGAAGFDLIAALPEGSKIVIEPGGRYLVPTGIALALPQGFEAQLRPRSGLARDFGVTVLNAPGTIDSDYRGEILVLLINHGSEAFEIIRGARIAQLVIAPFARAVFIEVDSLPATPRGSDGFGSTGQMAGREEMR
ncbi:MAG TPA: dUTP diphosphatase [Methylocella sp.]|nr:dUTP diphosphatase [Methylocella sp.]